jgi:bacteriocin-like protein
MSKAKDSKTRELTEAELAAVSGGTLLTSTLSETVKALGDALSSAARKG